MFNWLKQSLCSHDSRETVTALHGDMVIQKTTCCGCGKAVPSLNPIETHNAAVEMLWRSKQPSAQRGEGGGGE